MALTLKLYKCVFWIFDIDEIVFLVHPILRASAQENSQIKVDMVVMGGGRFLASQADRQLS